MRYSLLQDDWQGRMSYQGMSMLKNKEKPRNWKADRKRVTNTVYRVFLIGAMSPMLCRFCFGVSNYTTEASDVCYLCKLWVVLTKSTSKYMTSTFLIVVVFSMPE